MYSLGKANKRRTVPDEKNEPLQHLKEVSRIKHRILEKYLPLWAIVLGSVNKELNYFDCFAGPGQYELKGEPVPGSPAIAIEVAKAFLKERPTHSLKIVLTENTKDQMMRLEGHLEALKPYPRNLRVELLPEDSTAYVPDLLKKVRSLAPSFFMIDPYWHPLSVPVIRKILLHPRTEALITLMWNQINRDLDNSVVQRYVDELFGHRLWRTQTFMKQTGVAREAGFLKYFISELGAKYVLRFRIGFDPEDKQGHGRTKYYLLHGSTSPKAALLMKEVMWPLGNEEGTFHYSASSQGILISQTPRFEELKELLLRRFAGRELSFDEIREQTWDEPFIEKHYREVIRKLQTEGTVTLTPVSSKKSGLKGKDLVRFH
jgi:three-Cys-motif partner protein